MSAMGETTAQIQSAIDRFNAGDPKALNQLFERARKRFEQMAHRMLQNWKTVHEREQTGDLVQETCISLMKDLAKMRVTTAQEFFRLSAAIMRNRLNDLARRHGGREGPEAQGRRAIREAEAARREANRQRGGEETNDPAKLAPWTEFHECAKALPEEPRETFDLLYYHGLTQEEAAQVLGIPVIAVKRRWRDAKLALFEKLGDSLLGIL